MYKKCNLEGGQRRPFGVLHLIGKCCFLSSFFFNVSTCVQTGNADSPSMTASTAPPAQNSMRICQRVEKKNTGSTCNSTLATQVSVYIKQLASNTDTVFIRFSLFRAEQWAMLKKNSFQPEVRAGLSWGSNALDEPPWPLKSIVRVWIVLIFREKCLLLFIFSAETGTV